MDDILVVGVNHKVASIEARERLAFGPERIPGALCALTDEGSPLSRQRGGEVVLLSTCNRSELYARTSTPWATENTAEVEGYIRRFLTGYSGLSTETLDQLLYVYTGEVAARHLLRVAAGLDSLVVGENEILGQVKTAFDIAQNVGTIGPYLSGMFRYAIQTGKRVRAETEIGKAGLSVATVVVELAEEVLGPLDERVALLIGAGKISSMTARALVNAGLRCVLVANRTYERAQKLARNLGERCASAVHFDRLAENMTKADIVICSTGAPHVVLHLETVQVAMEARCGRKLLIADLAIPRDVDPRVAGEVGVMLRDIDALQTLVEARHPLAVAVRQEAEAIVREELGGYRAWCQTRRCAPMIRALRAKADDILQAELERTMRRLGDLTPEQQRSVEAMGQAIVNKLLHDPILCIKEPPAELSSGEAHEVIQTLFGITPVSQSR